jgi:hypothetical protein
VPHGPIDRPPPGRGQSQRKAESRVADRHSGAWAEPGVLPSGAAAARASTDQR